MDRIAEYFFGLVVLTLLLCVKPTTLKGESNASNGQKDAFLVKIFESPDEGIKAPKKAKTKKVSLETIERLIMQADEAYNRGDFAKSLELYEKAYLHEQEINNGAYRLLLETNLAYLLGRTGNIKKTKELIDSCHNKENFLYSMGLGLLEEGEFEAARGLLEEYLFEDKKGFMLLLLGVVYERRDDLQKARLFYESAYSKNSLDPYFSYAYARILDILKEYDRAIIIYKKASKSDNEELKNYSIKRIKILQHSKD